MRPSKEQESIQEEEYNIPYHYLVSWKSLIAFPEKLQTCPIYMYYLQEIISKMGTIEQGMLVLDVGCGDGRLIYELRKQGCPALLTGIDYSERAIQFARIYNPGVEFRLADLTKANSFPSKAYDVVISAETLEHIEPSQLSSAINNLMSRVKPGGKLIITVPHTNRPLDAKHYQHFTKQSLRIAMQNYCTKSLKIYGFNRKSHKQIVFKILVALFYFLYPLKKVGLTSLVTYISNLGFNFFEKHLALCSTEKGYSLIAIWEKKK